MMWTLLLAIPVLIVAMGVWARSGKVTATDDYCTALDLQLDRQAETVRDGAGAQVLWMPAPRTASRVAPRAMSSLSGELLAG